tara:strand:+ start:652 stop:834 length:183 start_codon:yes stop_codon:yes gene_type:complete
LCGVKPCHEGLFIFVVLCAYFVIPYSTPQFENVQKAKQEQRKRKEDSGDPPEEDEGEASR